MGLNQGWIYRERVEKAGAGQSVLDYYARRYQHSSRTDWRRRIQLGQVRVEESQVEPETVVRPGQLLTYHRPPWVEPEVPLDLEILHEDADLWAVNKPSALPVLPGAGFLEHTVLRQWQHRYPSETPVPVHRLGRGTSGLMLIARSPQARSSLSQQLRDRQMVKVYRALVGAWNLGDRHTITQPIGKIPHPTLNDVYGASLDGRTAHSECRVLERRSGETLLEVTITTGRPHQIRIHLASVGSPLLGDPLYRAGGGLNLPENVADPIPVPGDCGYHLHAYQLTFRHPRTGKMLALECPPSPLLKLSAASAKRSNA